MAGESANPAADPGHRIIPKGFQALTEDSVDDTIGALMWGPPGSGKTLHVVRYWPLPLGIINLDRKLTKAHLTIPGMRERLDQIYITNLREETHDVNHLEASRIKDGIDAVIESNLEVFRGGTILLDGGTLFRSVLKMGDETIATKTAQGKRFNPKDKEQINAYLASLINFVTDREINFVMTAHSANKWEMQRSTDDFGNEKNQLMKTTKLYPQIDDVVLKFVSLSLLFYVRCKCGKPIVNEDGSCSNVLCKEVGRKHMTRFATNKHFTRAEGAEFEDLTYEQIRVLCFDPKKAEALLP